ncbi:hypothetical protein BC826DRAFT_1085131, partial [Russula brevipes]
MTIMTYTPHMFVSEGGRWQVGAERRQGGAGRGVAGDAAGGVTWRGPWQLGVVDSFASKRGRRGWRGGRCRTHTPCVCEREGVSEARWPGVVVHTPHVCKCEGVGVAGVRWQPAFASTKGCRGWRGGQVSLYTPRRICKREVSPFGPSAQFTKCACQRKRISPVVSAKSPKKRAA